MRRHDQTYPFAGGILHNGDGTTTLRILVNGQVRLQVRATGPYRRAAADFRPTTVTLCASTSV